MKSQKLKKTAFYMLCAGLLAGCATTAPQSSEERVATRAQARMNALVAKEYRKVHGFFTPAYRDNLPYEAWLKSRLPRAQFVSGRVLQVECSGPEVCDVELESVYRSPAGVRAMPKGEIARVVPQRWIQVDGEWWLYQRK